ncbi:D-arabinose 1-dehydrogenase-like Zn-dependent alcohol dehydrogenase [Sphingomonas leidyi]|uniref:alcohol dehydrogenase n=1 Tax=Sphingomonas leidyi TaxID=68569 RepID=A0A7X5UXV0_9SPHN|nr:alcohol dehydrogenase catalytic domain-containing protein [Sphingomonas leidyi]NIJ64207.1 D-arabinose 1-dehydrogenase-like Zn-dependent alcohol dehydrogenase [Sphingomonas leidyi]
MHAYQVVEFGTPIVRNDVIDPTPTGTEVVVDVVACGLCHSDAHFHEGHLGLGGDARLPVDMIGIRLPTSLGHEIFGRIASFGPDAGLSEEDVGRPVVVYPWIGCGTCEACLAERDNECPNPRSIGLQVSGGHAEKVVVREPKYLVPADGLDEDYAGIFACCGLTAYAALAKLPRRDGWIGIIGAGGVGTMALSIEKGLENTKVAVFDINPAKLIAAANDFGADRTVNSKEEGAADAIKQETGGFIGVLDFVGSQQTADLGISLLRNGGTYVGVGLFGGEVRLPLAVLASRQLNLQGSYCGSPAELRALVEHAKAGRIKPIPTRVAPIDTINQGLAELRGGKIEGRLVHRHAGPHS